MKYANWTTKSEMKELLRKYSKKEMLELSGVPLLYEDDEIYIDEGHNNTLVIGAPGSGKTQSIILPSIELAIKAKESFLVNDVKGELYKYIGNKLDEEKYQTIVINLENPDYGNGYNILSLPYSLYMSGNKDASYDELENIGYYIFKDVNKNADPFWYQSASNLFQGLAVYLFENAKIDEINIKSIYNLLVSISSDDESSFEKEIKKLDTTSFIRIKLFDILSSPVDTLKSIIATFNQKINNYVAKEGLSNMLSTSDFDITDISNKKIAIFVISGTLTVANNIIPLLVNQIVSSVNYFSDQCKKFNMILDEFDTLMPIYNFPKMIAYSRSINVIFTAIIKSFMDLENVYGKEDAYLIKICFGNMIYLFANDIYTLEEISNTCGKIENGKPLITIEEIKTLKQFEAIVIIPRHLPFKTVLTPNYKIDWGYETKEKELNKRLIKDIKIIKL